MAFPPASNGNWDTALQEWSSYERVIGDVLFKSIDEIYGNFSSVYSFDATGSGTYTTLALATDLGAASVNDPMDIAIFGGTLYVGVLSLGASGWDARVFRWDGGSTWTTVYTVADSTSSTPQLWTDGTYLYFHHGVKTFRASTPGLGNWSEVVAYDQYWMRPIDGSPFREGDSCYVWAQGVTGDSPGTPTGDPEILEFAGGTITQLAQSSSISSSSSNYKEVRQDEIWMKISTNWGPTTNYTSHTSTPTEGSIKPLIMPNYTKIFGVDETNQKIRYFDDATGEWDSVVDDIDADNYYDDDGNEVFIRSDGSALYSAYAGSGFGAYLTRNNNFDTSFITDTGGEEPLTTYGLVDSAGGIPGSILIAVDYSAVTVAVDSVNYTSGGYGLPARVAITVSASGVVYVTLTGDIPGSPVTRFMPSSPQTFFFESPPANGSVTVCNRDNGLNCDTGSW